MAVYLFLLRLLELHLAADPASEIYVGTAALLMGLAGIWLSRERSAAGILTERPPQHTPDSGPSTVTGFGLSRRELEVLLLIAEGMSNGEIAERLFLSPNTVKTHCSRLFEKMDVKRRTQAVDKAKKLRIIA